jgi:hypothetical protein
VYQGPRGSCLMKKQISKISCQGPIKDIKNERVNLVCGGSGKYKIVFVFYKVKFKNSRVGTTSCNPG